MAALLGSIVYKRTVCLLVFVSQGCLSCAQKYQLTLMCTNFAV